MVRFCRDDVDMIPVGTHRSRGFQLLCMAVSLGFVTSAAADYVVQVGAYTDLVYAREAADALRGAGFPTKGQRFVSATGREMIRVLVGPFPELREANAALDRLRSQGRRGIVRSYEGLEGETIALPPPSIPAPNTRETPEAPQVPSTGEVVPAEPPAPEDALFALGLGEAPAKPRVDGYFQSELAYTTPSPSHLSKARQTLELGGTGRWGSWAKWRLSGRFTYDAVFDINDYYPESVREDQRTEAMLRETYVDLSSGDWDLRLGRQHIIWGEMIGLFFADVVSAKDLREFILPDFDYLRIPQWAARAEYFHGDFHGELVWIPYQTYDDIGVPGAQFYPYPPQSPPGYGYVIEPENRPDHSLENSGYGARFSFVRAGWDVSGFYYGSIDAAPYFSRRIVLSPTPAYIYTPDHDRIQQVGGTLSKDLVASVLRAEMIYSRDRWFNVDDPTDADGVVRQNTFDAVIGIEFPLPHASRLNLQAFQRRYPDYVSTMLQDKVESGASVYASTQFAGGRVEPSLMVIGSLNRSDWLARPKIAWQLDGHWKISLGADLFGGAPLGLFGRYDNCDRVNAEARYIF